MPERIRIAVVTGQHPYDVVSFYRLFRNIAEVDAYVQDLSDFSADAGRVRETYEAVLFYNFHQSIPSGQEPGWWEKPTKDALLLLGEKKQGIVVLHHAILAFPGWDLWTDITGVTDRAHFGYHLAQRIKVEIAMPSHPIVSGLSPWEQIEETYTMEEPGEGNKVLLSTSHSKSCKAIAWTRQYKDSRVFCLQLGHDNHAYANPHFAAVLSRGIQWVSRRI